MTEEKYNFVIARYWKDQNTAKCNHLCTYTLGSEVFYDTKENAEALAKSLSVHDEYRPFYISTDRD